jgi:hypothetical protein
MDFIGSIVGVGQRVGDWALIDISRHLDRRLQDNGVFEFWLY